MEIVTRHHRKDMLSPTDVSDFYRSMLRTVWLIRVIQKKDEQDDIFGGGVCLHHSGIILSVDCIFPDEDFEVYGKGGSTETFSCLELLARDSLHNLSLLAVKPVCGDTVLEFDFSVFSDNDPFIGQNVFSTIHVDTLFYSLAIGHVAYPHMRTYSNVKPDIEMRCMKNSSDPPFSGKKHSQALSLVQIYGLSTSDDSICGCPVFEATGRLIGLIGFIGLDFSYAISFANLREFCMEKRQLGFPQNITISFEGDRIVEVKTQKGVSGDLLVEYEALYQDKEPLSQQKHIRGISTWNFSQEDLKSQAALIHEDNGVSYAEDQDVSWEQCDQHDEVRLPAENSLRSNYSIGEPSQEHKLISLHDLEGLLASFPIETLHAFKGCS